jgi:hypothetical protein
VGINGVGRMLIDNVKYAKICWSLQILPFPLCRMILNIDEYEDVSSK